MKSLSYMLYMKKFNDFVIGKWILCALKAYLIHDLKFTYILEAFKSLV